MCRTWRSKAIVRVTSVRLSCAHHQHFTTLTDHKPVGRRSVTKEQYIRYFSLCLRVLDPGNESTDEELRQELEVRGVCLRFRDEHQPCGRALTC